MTGTKVAEGILAAESERPGTPGGRPPPARRPFHSPVWLPTAVVAAVLGLWIVAFLALGHDARDAARISYKNIHTSNASTSLRPAPTYRYEPTGRDYDGQYYYFIAVDPANARYYVDSPTYRYTRIVYPMTARALALGRASAIPYTLLLVNWLAMVGSVALLSVWLHRRGLSPWLSLLFGLYSGLFLAVTRDLAEPLAFALVALAVVLLDAGTVSAYIAAGCAFGLAGLTRETTAVFPLIFGLSALFAPSRFTDADSGAPRSPSAAAMLGLGLLPLLVYKAVLVRWLGSTDATTALLPDPIPLHGLLSYAPLDLDRWLEVVCVVVPALLTGGVALRALQRGMRGPEVWALLANVLFFVVFLNRPSYFNYTASGRIAAGVVLAGLLCIPVFDRILGGRRGWLWVCGALWTFLTPPLYLAYLLSGSSVQ